MGHRCLITKVLKIKVVCETYSFYLQRTSILFNIHNDTIYNISTLLFYCSVLQPFSINSGMNLYMHLQYINHT